MYTNAALLALSVVVFVIKDKICASFMSDLQSIEPPPDRMPATVGRKFNKRYLFFWRSKEETDQRR